MEQANGATLRGGIDLGGTKIEAIVVDAGHTVLGSSRHPTPASGGPEAVVAMVVLAGARPQESASAAQITARLIGDAHHCFMTKE